jgi:hypothetical protein
MTILSTTTRRLLGGAVALVAAMTFSASMAGAAQFQVKRQTQGLGLTAPGGGQLEDEHCGPGHVPCDDIFEKYCTKVLKGTMSGEQGWGGKTCWTPS